MIGVYNRRDTTVVFRWAVCSAASLSPRFFFFFFTKSLVVRRLIYLSTDSMWSINGRVWSTFNRSLPRAHRENRNTTENLASPQCTRRHADTLKRLPSYYVSVYTWHLWVTHVRTPAKTARVRDFFPEYSNVIKNIKKRRSNESEFRWPEILNPYW